MIVIAKCQNCEKERRVSGDGKSKGLCHVCYKKLLWKPKLVKCKRCERMLPNHAKGLCNGCYSSVFHIEKVKKWNTRYYHNIDQELYKKITSQCAICGFSKIVELHHLDHNRKNNASDNLVGICPNHHKMIHNRAFRKGIFQILKEKGFKVPETYKDDEFYKQNLTATIHKKNF